MAYLAPIEEQHIQPILPPAVVGEDCAEPGFSELEWSVVRLARTDRLWTVRPRGRIRRFWNWLLVRGNPELASPRLEALRRISVLSWHFGFVIPGRDVADFLAAGFSPDQYELLVSTVIRARGATSSRQSTEVLV